MRTNSLVRHIIAGAVCLVAAAGQAEARTWTNHEGKQIEADYVRLDGLKVVLLMSGKEVSVPLVNLSDADKQFVFEQQLTAARKAIPSPAAPTTDDSESDALSEPSSRAERATRKDDPADGVARIRTWKDNKGNTVRAKFIRIHDGNVILMQGRKTVPCPIENLSAEDLDYLRQFLTARGEGHLLPSADQLASRQSSGGEGGYSPPGGDAGGYSPYAAGAGGAASTPYTVDTPTYSPYSNPAGETPAYSPYSNPAGGAPYAASQIPDGMHGESASPTANEVASVAPYTVESSTYSPYSTPGGAQAYSAPQVSNASHGESGSSSSSAPGMYNPPGMSSPYSSTPDVRSAMPSITPNETTPYTSGSSFESPLAEQITYYCSNCNKEVPEHINDRCPHCGVRFDYVEQPDGSRKYNGRLWGGSIGGIIAVVIGVVVRLVIMAQRNS